jgi:cysteinyl-tRNA synthetase
MSANLKLYDTLSRQKVEFTPLDPHNVRMYVCGPTVYDYAHIGNARPVIVFDVLFRLLRHLYGADHVTYVRNLTDVDDKINKRAFERWDRKRPLNTEIRALTEMTAAQYQKDVRALGCLDPTHQPRATEYVCDGARPLDMVRIIEKLIARGHAYVADGHVLFDVPSMPAYGRLARRSLDEMVAGARVDVAPYKRDPMDFVLWKPSNPETEPGWESPGALADRAGISNARRWRARCWARCSTSMPAASTLCSPIMKTRSPRPAAPSARTGWRRSGCTTAS